MGCWRLNPVDLLQGKLFTSCSISPVLLNIYFCLLVCLFASHTQQCAEITLDSAQESSLALLRGHLGCCKFNKNLLKRIN